MGDSIYITVRNKGEQGIFVSLIDIGVSGRITVLTDSVRDGYRINADYEWTFGFDELSQKLTGMPLVWPTGLEPGADRPETLLIVVTSQPQDVTPF